ARRPQASRREVQEGRLPGAARPEHRDDLAVGHLQREAAERGDVAVPRAVEVEEIARPDRRHQALSLLAAGSRSARPASTATIATAARLTDPSTRAPLLQAKTASMSSRGRDDIPVTATSAPISR